MLGILMFCRYMPSWEPELAREGGTKILPIQACPALFGIQLQGFPRTLLETEQGSLCLFEALRTPLRSLRTRLFFS